MRKSEFEELAQTIKRARTTKLQAIRSDLHEIISERERTKSMYFWTPDTHASGRRWNEKKRNIRLITTIGPYQIDYKRNYQESCHHVYAQDYLYINGEKGTVADLKKMAAVCDEILSNRKK